MKLSTLKEQVDEKVSERKVFVRQVKESKVDLENLLNKMEDLEEVRVIFQKAAQITQNQISYHIENIVSHALAAVIEEKYTFKVDFVTRRNTSECDLSFVDEDGVLMKPLDSCGYGAADIASLALRVAYWKLSDNVRNTFILDEPTRNLDVSKQPLASKMIRQLSKELGIQFIIVTHQQALADEANKIFEVKKVGKISKIKEI